MPFQGNPNAGQPDPALLNLLFQQKQRREEMAYQQQQDALAAQRQAQLDAAEEARKTEKHKMDLLVSRAGLVDKLRAMAPDVDSAQRTAQNVTSQNFTQSDLLGGGGGEDFASIVAQNDPTAGAQLQQSNMAEANLATQIAMASELQQQLAPGIDRGTAVDATLGMGQAVESERARTADIELQKKLGEEGRSNAFAREQSKTAFNRSIDKAHIDATIAAGGDARKIVEMRREATKWAVVAQDTRLSPQARQYAQQMYTDLQNDIDADALRGISGEVMADNQRRTAALEDYTAIQRVHTVTKAMEARMRMGDLNHVGTRAQLAWWTNNIQGIIEDSIGVPFIDYYVGSVRDEINKAMKAGDVEYADRLEREMLDDATLERIATGQLRDIDAAWVAVRANNPSGRTSNLIYEDIKNVTETIGITISSALAGAKLRSNLRATAAALEDKRNLLHQQWPKLQFDPQTGAWVPATKLEAADDALFADPMTQAVTNRVRRADPSKMSPGDVNKALEWRRQRAGQ